MPEEALGTAPWDDAASGALREQAPWGRAWRRLRRDWTAWVALIVILAVVALAVSAGLLEHITGHSATDPNLETGTDFRGQPLPPGTNGYLLGTDNLGRDVLVRVAFGARSSLLVGLVASAIAMVIGVVTGVAAGYFKGWVDGVLGRVIDVVLSFPYLLVALVLAAVFGANVFIAVLVIAGFSWGPVARVIRGTTLSLREREFVTAAKAVGASRVRIMFLEIMPNLLSIIIVLTTLLIPLAVMFEASLAYLGLGDPPPAPSWGNMLYDASSISGYGAWWFLLSPAIALAATTVAFNVLGDSLRDALDPAMDRLVAPR